MPEAAIAPIDYGVGIVLGLAVLRGLLRGLLREVFSIAALGAAFFAVRLYTGQVADRMLTASNGGLSEASAPWFAGALLAVAAITAVAVVGSLARRGARAAGLSWADRAGGALIGAAEGVLVSAIAVSLLATLAGREHWILAESRSLAALERLEAGAEDAGLPAVAVER